ncbi:MAG: hypothetical protein QXM68_03475 [Candidatus Aenigmatarchaeota archaeon]|nr:hypothetical protein [Candidatus Aenigmarchaeota archaeon]
MLLKTKGVNALEIVFGALLLMIVVILVIRLLTNIVTPTKITGNLKNFEEAYNFEQEKAKCRDLCDQYISSDYVRQYAVNYCMQKVSIDISGDKRPGQKGQYGFVANLPFCEDGLYCFHIYQCRAGNYVLDATNCGKVLCEYYVNEVGLSPDDAESLITQYSGIHPGSCPMDVNSWNIRDKPTYPQGSNLNSADWWYQNANYPNDLCG